MAQYAWRLASAQGYKVKIDDANQAPEFWNPEFEYEHRSDGVSLMWQRAELQTYLPTLAHYIDKWADATPAQTWLGERRDGEWKRISFGDAREMARAIGGSLLAFRLGPDRPLLILSEKSLEHGLLSLACTYVGIPYAPVSSAYSLRSTDHAKLKDIVTLLKPGAVFADDGSQFEPACRAIGIPHAQIINSRNLIENAVSFDSLLTRDPATAIAARASVTSKSVVKYLFTSGSTASPKAVINTNGMICAMQAMVRDCYRFLVQKPPVILDWAPWNHTAAGNKVFYLAMTNGGSYYIDEGRPFPGKFEDTIKNLRDIPCSWYFNVPVGWDMLVGALENEPELAQTFFRRLDMMFYAGAGMAQHTWDRLRAIAYKTTGREVLLATGLGSTETAPFALACTEVHKQAGNVGVPSRGLTMKLVPIGDKLELRLKGPSITPGYLGDPKTTQDAFDEEGFYKMGDALRAADPDDFAKGFFFDGRIAENFKLNTGTWVAVGAVRGALVDAMGGLVQDAVIVGENEAELGALLLLSQYAQAMDQDNLLRNLSDALGAAAHNATGSSSCVRRAIVLESMPSFDRGEITEKGSLNQRVIRLNHSELIATLYHGGAAVIKV